MRLGGPIFRDGDDPERWAAEHRRVGYGAAKYPSGADDDSDKINAFAAAAKAADVVIAELGAWSSPLSPDAAARRQALEKCRRCLALADEIGARCCVNIAGSRGDIWDGPHPEDLAEETFDRVVETVRGIIDAVKPRRTFYTLETMPWMFPDSADSYLRLIKAIDRERFGVHLDPVNLVSSPQRYTHSADLLRECFAKLGPHIKSCHAKDVTMRQALLVHLDETRPGLGALDYGVYVQELAKLDPDTPLMLEHLETEAEYTLAADHIRGVAAEVGVRIR